MAEKSARILLVCKRFFLTKMRPSLAANAITIANSGIIALGILGLAGCATTRNNTDLEMQNMRSRVNELEAQLQEKDQQIAALQEALSQGAQAEMQVVPGVSLKDIQIALKNAGYDPGKLDAVMGRKTRKAIKDFQKANGLSVTGKVGNETWLLLQQYLHKKVK